MDPQRLERWMSASTVARVVEGLVPVVARLIENALTKGEDRAAAWERMADVAKLRASAQKKLDARRKK